MERVISPEQLREAFSKVPRALREFIAEGELAATAEQIAQQYQFHVDATGELVQLMTMILLGFISPADLPRELSKSFGLTSTQIPELIKELNTQIFIPLQKKVREAGPESSYKERVQEELGAQPVTTYESPSPKPTIPPLKVEVQQQPPPLMPATSTQAPSYNLARPDALAPAPPRIQMRTMQGDMNQLQHPQAAAQKPVPHPSQLTPARAFQTASIPFTAPQPLPPKPVPAYEIHHPTLPSVTIPAQPPESPEPKPITKEFGADPYREPV